MAMTDRPRCRFMMAVGVLLALVLAAPTPAKGKKPYEEAVRPPASPGRPPVPPPSDASATNFEIQMKDESRPGPWDADVAFYLHPDNGPARKVAHLPRAGVVSLARMPDGRIISAFQWFPEDDRAAYDQVAVSFSSDTGRTWSTPEVIRISGFPRAMKRPHDPTLLALPDGRIRLYFTSHVRGERSQLAPEGGVYSAISEDGLNYRFEPGLRLASARFLGDCAAVYHEGKYHLFVPSSDHDEQTRRATNVHALHGVSDDGLNFTQLPDLRIDDRRHWLGAAVSHQGKILFFGTGGGNDPEDQVWCGESEDGNSFRVIRSIKIPGVDPGVIRLPGAWLVGAGTSFRPGTASARPRGGPGGPRR